MKFKGLDDNQIRAVLTKACVSGRNFAPGATDEEILQGVMIGDLQVVIQNGELVLFDRNGRRIPPRGLLAAVCDANPNFRLNQPELDYAGRLQRLIASGLSVSISADDFKARCESIIAAVKADQQIENLLKGVHLPIVIPQMKINNLGTVTEMLVEAVSASYQRQFPGRPFTNHRKGELANQVSVVSGSRYQQLLDRLAQGPAIGVYFPACLQGFSVDAQREQMKILPEQFILSGPLDSANGWAMYPDVLARDFNTPGNDCSAVNWQHADFSLCFQAHDDCAGFGYGTNLGDARDYYSGGLLLLG